jgi:hypothetical protein
MVMASTALAGDTFWEDRQRGYFWYEDPLFKAPQDQEKADEEKPMIVQPEKMVQRITTPMMIFSICIRTGSS